MELRSGHRPRPRLTHAVFDWDGTLSLIRAGWAEVMLDQWMDLLPALPGETAEARRLKAHEDIWGLNGKPSIHQASLISRSPVFQSFRSIRWDWLERSRSPDRSPSARLFRSTAAALA